MPTRAFLLSADQKALDAITQILTELEISFEIIPDTAAGLKRIGTQHFDLMLVDCDGAQNASQLFAAAKSSALNQGAMAIAIAEGKNGVGNAFRLGASLVLSKPVSIEQARGTLRNALAVLRKAVPESKNAAHANASQPNSESAAARKSDSATAKPVSTVPPASPVKNAPQVAANSIAAKPATGIPKRELPTPITSGKAGAGKSAGIAVLGEEPLGKHPAPPTFGLSERETSQRRTSPFLLTAVAAALVAAGIYGYASVNPAFHSLVSTQAQRIAVLAHLAPKPQPVAAAPKAMPVPVVPPAQPPAPPTAEAATPAPPADGFAESQAAPVQGFQSSEPAKPTAPVIVNTSDTAPKGEIEAVVVPEDVADSHLAYRVLPVYPEPARRKGIKGSVVLNASIDRDGTVAGLEVVSGNPSLASAAVAAVKQWRYQVYYHNGQTSEFQTQITVHFPPPASH